MLAIYCGVIVAASLAGGWVPLVIRLTHRRMQIAISFVAGVMLGVGLLHLLPQSLQELGNIDAVVGWVLTGFMLMFFLERFFHFHHHDAPDDPFDDGGHALEQSHHEGHDHADDHAQDTQHRAAHRFAWGGAAIGLMLHTIVEGIALAAGVKAEQEAQSGLWAGLGIFLAIVLHKPFDSLTIGTLMAAGGWSAGVRHLVNALYALVVPLGVLLFYAGAGHVGDATRFLGQALGFAAGAFLCIASSDLLPELQFHRHDRGKLSLALLAGVAVAVALLYMENSGREHEATPPTQLSQVVVYGK